MPTVVTTLAGLIALAAISARATPVTVTEWTKAERDAGLLIELVAHGCGYGQRRTQWQDQWGQWQIGVAAFQRPGEAYRATSSRNNTPDPAEMAARYGAVTVFDRRDA